MAGCECINSFPLLTWWNFVLYSHPLSRLTLFILHKLISLSGSRSAYIHSDRTVFTHLNLVLWPDTPRVFQSACQKYSIRIHACNCVPLGVLIIVFVCLFVVVVFFAARFCFQGGSLRFSGYQVAYTIYGRRYLTLVSFVGASSISFLAWGKSVVIHWPVHFLTFIIV